MAAPGIFIEIADLYDWEPLKRSPKFQQFLSDVKPAQINQIQEGFAMYILNLFKSLIKNAIYYQHFPVKYEPLSPAWVAKKKKKGWHAGFWEATRFLVNNVTFWKYSKGKYAIGFHSNLPHPNSKNGFGVLDIIKVNEQGSADGRVPARPLFFPISAGISRSIYDVHFKRFISQKYPQLKGHLV